MAYLSRSCLIFVANRINGYYHATTHDWAALIARAGPIATHPVTVAIILATKPFLVLAVNVEILDG